MSWKAACGEANEKFHCLKRRSIDNVKDFARTNRGACQKK